MFDVKVSAIDLLTLKATASRIKSHFDAVIGGIKTAKAPVGRFGYNEHLKSVTNGVLIDQLDWYKEQSDAVESDIRRMKSALVKHNSMVKIGYTDLRTGQWVEVSVFEAFNVLKDAENDLSQAHSMFSANMKVDVPKDNEVAVEFEDLTDTETTYQELMALIYQLKTGIAKANNKTVKFELESVHLAELLGLSQ